MAALAAKPHISFRLNSGEYNKWTALVTHGRDEVWHLERASRGVSDYICRTNDKLINHQGYSSTSTFSSEGTFLPSPDLFLNLRQLFGPFQRRWLQSILGRALLFYSTSVAGASFTEWPFDDEKKVASCQKITEITCTYSHQVKFVSSILVTYDCKRAYRHGSESPGDITATFTLLDDEWVIMIEGRQSECFINSLQFHTNLGRSSAIVGDQNPNKFNFCWNFGGHDEISMIALKHFSGGVFMTSTGAILDRLQAHFEHLINPALLTPISIVTIDYRTTSLISTQYRRQMQVDHREARTALISSIFGIVGSAIFIIPTHGVSLVPLIYKVPLLIKAIMQFWVTRRLLKQHNLPTLKLRKREIVIPMIALGMAAAIGFDVDAQLDWNRALEKLQGGIPDVSMSGLGYFLKGVLDGIGSSLHASAEVAGRHFIPQGLPQIEEIDIPAELDKELPTPGGSIFENSLHALRGHTDVSFFDNVQYGTERLTTTKGITIGDEFLTSGHGKNFGEALGNVAVGEFVEYSVGTVLTRAITNNSSSKTRTGAYRRQYYS